jgi:hypothetical protein
MKNWLRNDDNLYRVIATPNVFLKKLKPQNDRFRLSAQYVLSGK